MAFKLMNHQSQAVDFAIDNNGIAAFFHEVGCGKTLSALSTFSELRKKDPTLKMLVICPLSLIHGAWSREIEKFTSYNWCDLHDKKENRRFKNGTVDIWLINFEYLISERGYENTKVIVDNFTKLPWLCVIDESSKMKNNKAKTVERILQLKSLFKHRIIMSGTPAPNVEWEYWPQMFFLDDSILGSNFYKFKNTHFALHRGDQVVPGQCMNRSMIRKMHEQGFKYQIIPSKREEMFERMKPWCHFVQSKDCLDLPEEIDELRVVEMTAPQKKIYNQMKSSYIAELTETDSFAVANVALTKLMKLRQITSGFAVDDRGDAVAVTKTNPKLNELMDIIEECGNEQIIIWCQFHYEIDTIKKILSEEGYCISELHGRVPQKERGNHLDNFLNGKSRFLIAHPSSAAHGLTLVNSHICVFFSMDYSMESYTQARGRIYRNGQKNNCIYFHILAKDSIDLDVLAIVQRKEDAQKIMERYLKHADN